MTYTNGKKVLECSACEAVYTSSLTILRYLTGLEPENGCAIVDKNGTRLQGKIGVFNRGAWIRENEKFSRTFLQDYVFSEGGSETSHL